MAERCNLSPTLGQQLVQRPETSKAKSVAVQVSPQNSFNVDFLKWLSRKIECCISSSSSSTSDDPKHFTTTNGKARHHDATTNGTRQSASKRNGGKKKRKGEALTPTSTTVTSQQHQQQPIYMEVEDAEYRHDISDFTSSGGSSTNNGKGNKNFIKHIITNTSAWHKTKL